MTDEMVERVIEPLTHRCEGQIEYKVNGHYIQCLWWPVLPEQVAYGCVHEHLSNAWVCPKCYEGFKAGKASCSECREIDGHWCPISEIGTPELLSTRSMHPHQVTLPVTRQLGAADTPESAHAAPRTSSTPQPFPSPEAPSTPER